MDVCRKGEGTLIMRDRRTILLLALMLVAGVCALLAWTRSAARRQSAEDAAANRARAEGWLKDLRGVGGGSAAEAVRAAKPGDRVNLSPEPVTQPLGPGDFTDQQVMLSGQSLGLRELVESLRRLEAEGMQARSIRLAMPPGQENGTEWSVEVVLGRLVYSPGKGASR